MPKLKVGDTFVLTKEMAEAKVASFWSSEVFDEIGRELKVKGVTKDSYYLRRVDGKAFYHDVFEFSVVDDYLPEKFAKKSPQKRTWKTEIKSSDGIEIRDGKVNLTICDDNSVLGFSFTLDQLSQLANQIRAAKEQLKKLNPAPVKKAKVQLKKLK